MSLDTLVRKLNVLIVGLGNVGEHVAYKLAHCGRAVNSIHLICSDDNWEDCICSKLSHDRNKDVRSISRWGANYAIVPEYLLENDINLVMYTVGSHHSNRDHPDMTKENIGLAKHIAPYFKDFKGSVIIVPNPVWIVSYAFQRESGMDPSMVTGFQHIDSYRFENALMDALKAEGLARLRDGGVEAICSGHHGDPILETSSVTIRNISPFEQDIYLGSKERILGDLKEDIQNWVKGEIKYSNTKYFMEIADALSLVAESLAHGCDTQGPLSLKQAREKGLKVISGESADENGVYFGRPGFFDAKGRFIPVTIDERTDDTKKELEEKLNATKLRHNGLIHGTECDSPLRHNIYQVAQYSDITPEPIHLKKHTLPTEGLIYIQDNKVIDMDRGYAIFEHQRPLAKIYSLKVDGNYIYIGLDSKIVRLDIKTLEKRVYETDRTGGKFYSIGILHDDRPGKAKIISANKILGVYAWDIDMPNNPIHLIDKQARFVISNEKAVYIGLDLEKKVLIYDGKGLHDGFETESYPIAMAFFRHSARHAFLLECRTFGPKNQNGTSIIGKWDMSTNRCIKKACIPEKTYDACGKDGPRRETFDVETMNEDIIGIGARGKVILYDAETLNHLQDILVDPKGKFKGAQETDGSGNNLATDISCRRLRSNRHGIYVACDVREEYDISIGGIVHNMFRPLHKLENLAYRCYDLAFK